MFGESNIAVVKIMFRMEYDEHQIFKATLVSQPTANPFLSKDKQVKKLIYFNSEDDYTNISSSPIAILVKLACDVGIFFCVQKFNHNFFNSENCQEMQQRKIVNKQHPNFNFPRS